MPGGALVDAARSERLVAGDRARGDRRQRARLCGLADLPGGARRRGAACRRRAACSGPAIAAISLGLVGHAAIGERLGRNARFASIGNGLAAAAMGACGYFFSARAVFFVTARAARPGLAGAARHVGRSEIDPERAHGGPPRQRDNRPPTNFADLLRQRPLLILAGCVMLFHLANAAMLPLMGSVLTMRSSQWATVLIAACIVVPQLVVALISPWVGRQAQIVGTAAVAAPAASPRCRSAACCSRSCTDPYLLVAVQLLDGITAAVLGVMVPLIVADLTRGTGHFNLGARHRRHRDRASAPRSAPTLAGYAERSLRQPSRVPGLGRRSRPPVWPRSGC